MYKGSVYEYYKHFKGDCEDVDVDDYPGGSNSSVIFSILDIYNGSENHTIPSHSRVLLNKNMRFPTDQLYEEAEVSDIRQMYYLNLAIDVIRKEGEELKKIDHNYKTRKNCPFLIPRTTSSKGHKSRSYMVARVFN
ncbi:hypothetical protein HHI36_015871 [Cryptolaemus montrouzieri]|uniref:Uncharacterized protein n=1 Tax=Cryptolaemus montrouzieri TaxID=559131 RepID=A0ABD2N787_9CUCU